MPATNDYEVMWSLIVSAFADLLRISIASEDDGSDECIVASMRAFDTAKAFGWDAAEDQDFTGYCLKATGPEIAVEGLRRALTKCRPVSVESEG